jgi:tRNA pseudouridine38-40 synthase
LARYVWHYPYPLAEEEMERSAILVAGEHDFTSFAAVDPERRRGDASGLQPATASVRLDSGQAPNRSRTSSHEAGVRAVHNVRNIFSSSWERLGEELVYTVRGSGFLHHMVRNLVGTFVLVGKGTFQVQDISRILAARNRSAAGATAPASGLYLVGVEY